MRRQGSSDLENCSRWVVWAEHCSGCCCSIHSGTRTTESRCDTRVCRACEPHTVPALAFPSERSGPGHRKASLSVLQLCMVHLSVSHSDCRIWLVLTILVILGVRALFIFSCCSRCRLDNQMILIYARIRYICISVICMFICFNVKFGGE